MCSFAQNLCKETLVQHSKHNTNNIAFRLLSREYENRSNPRKDNRITRSLIKVGSYILKKSWCIKSSQRITCDGRFAFFSNYQTCVDCSSSQEQKAHVKFSLPPRSRSEKIEDAIIMAGTPESFDLPHKGYKESLLAITKDSALLRIDLDSGHVLEKVKLGQPSIKFQKINWNAMDETFVITSKQCPRQTVQFPRNLERQEAKDFIHFVIMSCMPLGFIAKFCVSREIFGKNAVEAVVSLDILMIMYSTNHVRMYSFPALFNQFRTHNHHLYEIMPDGSEYGSDQSPLTHNMTITECPPCILEVRCRYRDVMVTMPPCHYVMWPWSQSNGYCCFSVQTGEMVGNGCLIAEEDSLEEKVALHADDSGRIVHMKNSELRVYKLVPQPGLDNRKMVADFIIDLSTPSSSQPEINPCPNVSLSGRIIKKRVVEDCQTIADRTVLSMMYCEDMDMIVLLSCFGDGCDSQITTVGFYDNWNGKLQRQFELTDAPTEEVTERFFTYEGDTVTHVFRTLQGKMECDVYKLQCLNEERTSKQEDYQPKSLRRQTLSRERR